MKRTRNLVVGATFVAALVTLGIVRSSLEESVVAQGKGDMVMVPRYEVDPTFPKQLPNHWYQGMTIGISIDPQDHVWIIHRPDSLSPSEAAEENKTGACCVKAPPVIEFDQQGNVLRHWGGPGQGHSWPTNNHGLTMDHKGNIWLGGNGADDGQVLKFTQDGKFLMEVGRKTTVDSNSTEHFGRVSNINFDPEANEAYIADGYGNKRVAVIDADTGKFKRYWGAYGNKPDDADLGRYNPDAPLAQQFRNPVHCVNFSKDRLVYVCDRVNDRIQVFTPEGKFVKEKIISPKTLGDGSVWEIAFSRDPEQKFMFVSDGHDEKVWILDRQSLEVLTSIGDGGKQPGQFYAVHSIGLDSKNNLYTTETYDGRRVQRFLYKGMQSIRKGMDQGTVWPKAR